MYFPKGRNDVDVYDKDDRRAGPLECICDRCGKKITLDDIVEWEEKYLIRFTGGYGSVFGDGE
jgi:hypothetical protein